MAVTRSERARLRLLARRYACDYLMVSRLPAGVPAIVRAYADGFASYPSASEYGNPMRGLAERLRPYRRFVAIL